MKKTRSARVIWFIIMILIGIAIGLYYTWIVNPVEFVDATFHHLRQDYKADYVLMAAEIYNQDHVLYQALMRLDALFESSTDEAMDNAITNAEKLGYSEMDIDLLYQLKNAISGDVSTPTPEIDETLMIGMIEESIEPTQSMSETPSFPNVDANQNALGVDENPFATPSGNEAQTPEPLLTADAAENFFTEGGDNG